VEPFWNNAVVVQVHCISITTSVGFHDDILARMHKLQSGSGVCMVVAASMLRLWLHGSCRLVRARPPGLFLQGGTM
jgi:hypothetical protein